MCIGDPQQILFTVRGPPMRTLSRPLHRNQDTEAGRGRTTDVIPAPYHTLGQYSTWTATVAPLRLYEHDTSPCDAIPQEDFFYKKTLEVLQLSSLRLRCERKQRSDAPAVLPFFFWNCGFAFSCRDYPAVLFKKKDYPALLLTATNR